jgi:SAM-dependent methyltransferase
MLLPADDVFGEALLGALAGRSDPLEIVFSVGAERLVSRTAPHELLVVPEALPARDRALLERWARGRVLDVGMGAAGHLLWLQRRGFAVAGIDQGPLIVEAARRRGAREVYALAWEDITPAHCGQFDTITLLGNVIGAPGDVAGSRRMLKALHALLTLGGQLICTSVDTSLPECGGWDRRRATNVTGGRYPGAFVYQLVYRGHAAAPVPWLALDCADLRELAVAAGWDVMDVVWETDLAQAPLADECAARWYALRLARGGATEAKVR